MRFYEELDKIKPYTQVVFEALHATYPEFYWVKLVQSHSWDRKYGWTYWKNDLLNARFPSTPQSKCRNSETNTSCEAYTLVYKRWGSLIKKIKEDISDQEITKVIIGA